MHGPKDLHKWDHNNNVYKGFDPIFKKDIVNVTSNCLKHKRGKSMQMLLNHMKANFLFNAKTSLMVSCIPMCSMSCEHCIDRYPRDQWDDYKHNGGMWLRDGIFKVEFVKRWRKMFMTNKTSFGLVELWTNHLNMKDKNLMDVKHHVKRFVQTILNGVLKSFDLFIDEVFVRGKTPTCH